jgi:hypothetical protein
MPANPTICEVFVTQVHCRYYFLASKRTGENTQKEGRKEGMLPTSGTLTNCGSTPAWGTVVKKVQNRNARTIYSALTLRTQLRDFPSNALILRKERITIKKPN